jgi:hypothetical protein
VNPTQPVPVGRTGVTATRLGLELAPIGGPYRVGRRLVPASYQEVVDSVVAILGVPPPDIFGGTTLSTDGLEPR